MKKNSIILLLLIALLLFALTSCGEGINDSDSDNIIIPNAPSDSHNSDTNLDSDSEDDLQTDTDISIDSETDVDTNTESENDGEDLVPDITKVVSVGFNCNSSDQLESIELTVGEQYILPTPVKNGYIFDGWFYNDTAVSQTGKWSISNDVELIAEWSKQEYKISYDFNGGEVNSENYPKVYDIETNTLLIGIPKRNGYKFIGWQDENTIEYNYRINSGTYGDISLKAMWYKYEYTYQDESGIQYLLKNDNTLSVVGYVGKTGSINIPYTYNDYTVTEIGSYAFCGYGDELAKLSSSDFYRCDIPDTVKKICIGAFEGCDDLKVQLSSKSVITAEEWTSNLVIEERNDHVYDVINGTRPAIGWKKYWIPGV